MTTHPVSPSIMAEMEKRLAEPRQNTRDGYTVGGYAQPIWTPAGFLARGHRYVLKCACGHRADAPLQRMVDEGRGDLPMHVHKWRCAQCQGTEINIELPDEHA